MYKVLENAFYQRPQQAIVFINSDISPVPISISAQKKGFHKKNHFLQNVDNISRFIICQSYYQNDQTNCFNHWC